MEAREFLEFDIKYTNGFEEEIVFSADKEGEELANQIIQILSDFLWKIGMRIKGKEQFYNIDREYIEDFLEGYFMCYTEVRPYGFNYSEKYVSSKIKKREYVGKLYRMGRKSTEPLIGFYEKRGFKEAYYVNTEWKIFSPMPYVAMIYNVKEPCGLDMDSLEMNGMLV